MVLSREAARAAALLSGDVQRLRLNSKSDTLLTNFENLVLPCFSVDFTFSEHSFTS
jgi:hypothetical protein